MCFSITSSSLLRQHNRQLHSHRIFHRFAHKNVNKHVNSHHPPYHKQKNIQNIIIIMVSLKSSCSFTAGCKPKHYEKNVHHILRRFYHYCFSRSCPGKKSAVHHLSCWNGLHFYAPFICTNYQAPVPLLRDLIAFPWILEINITRLRYNKWYYIS